jgi:outer membrane lipoprotein SlyB
MIPRRTKMRPIAPLLAVCLALPLGLVACAPVNTNSTYTARDIGRSASISYGVIVSMRNVEVQGQPTGVGTMGGVAVGATAGSLLGRGDPRANIIGAIAGAIVGGIAGNAIERSASTGMAVEFIIREDDGQTISVVQTNEDGFRPGDRVVLTRGARTRLQHAGPGV